MIENILKFINDKKEQFSQKCKVIQGYNFMHITKNTTYKKNEHIEIDSNIEKSQIIMLYYSEKFNKEADGVFIIIGFEKTLIFLDILSISFLQQLLSTHTHVSVCFLYNLKNVLNQKNIQKEISEDREIKSDETFVEELDSFKKYIPQKKKKK